MVCLNFFLFRRNHFRKDFFLKLAFFIFISFLIKFQTLNWCLNFIVKMIFQWFSSQSQINLRCHFQSKHLMSQWIEQETKHEDGCFKNTTHVTDQVQGVVDLPLMNSHFCVDEGYGRIEVFTHVWIVWVIALVFGDLFQLVGHSVEMLFDFSLISYNPIIFPLNQILSQKVESLSHMSWMEPCEFHLFQMCIYWFLIIDFPVYALFDYPLLDFNILYEFLDFFLGFANRASVIFIFLFNCRINTFCYPKFQSLFEWDIMVVITTV